MLKLRIILLGTGAGEQPYIGRNGVKHPRLHSSALFIFSAEGREYYFLVDYTPYTALGLMHKDIPFSNIDAIGFSHPHEDHFDFNLALLTKLNVGSLRLGFDPEYSRKVMRVYAPENVIDTIIEMLDRKECRSDRKVVENNYIKYCISNQIKDTARLSYQGKYNRSEFKKEILNLCAIPPGTTIDLIDGLLKMKCVGVKHSCNSVYAHAAKGDFAFGFLFSFGSSEKRFNALYLTDYETNFDRDKLTREVSEFGSLDLLILGMPILFPNKWEAKRHMGLRDTLSFFHSLRGKNIIKKNTRIILTHFSDRLDSKEAKKKVRKVIRKHWPKNKLGIPKKDGFEIIYDGRRIKTKGGIIKNS